MKNYKTTILTIILIILFLVLARDKLHQWDEACFLSEAAYNKDYGFKCFSYDHFRVHKIILAFLVDIFGTGLNALFFVDLVYAFFIIVIIFNLYYFCRLFFNDVTKARYISLIGLFLPITLYMGYKTISEVPALMFVSFALVFIVKGLKGNQRYRIFWYSIAGILVYLSSISRFDGPVLTYSFLGALFIINLFKKPVQNIRFKDTIIAISLVSFVFIVCFLLVFLFTGFNGYERFVPSKAIYETLNIDYDESKLPKTYENYKAKKESRINSELESSSKFNVRIVTIFKNFIRKSSFNFSLFGIFMLVSLFALKNMNVKFTWIFYILSLFPVALVTRFSESRYTYSSLIPLAIVIYFGAERLLKYKLFRKNKLLIVAIFVLIVLLNLTFINYMEANVSEGDYDLLIKKLQSAYGSFSIFVPIQWSDYSYLKYAYPELNVYSVQEKEEGLMTVLKSDKVEDIDQLKTIVDTKIYVCYERFKYFSYLERMVMHIELFKRKLTGNQCEGGWIWDYPGIALNKIAEEGRYQAYLIDVG